MATIRKPTRSQLQKSITDQQAVLAFEQLFDAANSAATAADLDALTATVAALRPFAPGDIVYSAATTRAGALLANGQSVLRATYAALFAAIGTTYGSVDGTHFNVPDITGRVVAGKEASATRLTTAKGGVDGATLGAVGGVQEHILSAAQMPVHTHTVTDSGHVHGISDLLVSSGGASTLSGSGSAGVGSPNTASATTGITNQNAGSGSAHPNVQPTIVLNAFIIY